MQHMHRALVLAGALVALAAQAQSAPASTPAPNYDPRLTFAPLSLPDIERTVSALGAKLAAARAERGWSLAELARRAGVSTASVHKIEKSGMTPTIATLMKVASALGMTEAQCEAACAGVIPNAAGA